MNLYSNMRELEAIARVQLSRVGALEPGGGASVCFLFEYESCRVLQNLKFEI